MSLPTNLKNDILDETVNTVRRYNVRRTSDNQIVEADVYLEEITEYEQMPSILLILMYLMYWVVAKLQ